MWTKLYANRKRLNRLTDIFMTTSIVLQVFTSFLDGNARMLVIQACFAVFWIGLMLVTAYLDRQQDREKKHSQDIDTDRLTRLSLPEIYEDYLRRKSQAQSMYESEVAALDKDYAQYLNVLEEEAQNADSL